MIDHQATKKVRREMGDQIDLVCDCCRRRYRRLMPFLKHQNGCHARVAGSVCLGAYLVSGQRPAGWVVLAAEQGRFVVRG